MSDLNGLRSLYRHTAPFYEENIIPAFGPLAENLALWIARCASQHISNHLFDPFDVDNLPVSPSLKTIMAIDLGTGTGLLARTLAPMMQQVIGSDVSTAMLNIAQMTAPDNVRFIIADNHALPFCRRSIPLVVSSFGLNASTPRRALRTVIEVLRPGGMLAFQEWGALDETSRIVEDTLAEHMPEDIPGMDQSLRDFYAAPKHWEEQLQDVEDYYEMLKLVGFELVWVKEAPFAMVHFPSVEMFTRYKFTWPARRFTLESMTPQARATFLSDLHAELRNSVNEDGSLDWQPSLFRVFAVKS